MIAHIYDEISCEWKEVKLIKTPNAHALTAAVSFFVRDENAKEIYNDAELNPDCDSGWVYVSHSVTGPILTIYSRSDRGHHGITVIDLES